MYQEGKRKRLSDLEKYKMEKTDMMFGDDESISSSKSTTSTRLEQMYQEGRRKRLSDLENHKIEKQEKKDASLSSRVIFSQISNHHYPNEYSKSTMISSRVEEMYLQGKKKISCDLEMHRRRKQEKQASLRILDDRYEQNVGFNQRFTDNKNTSSLAMYTSWLHEVENDLEDYSLNRNVTTKKQHAFRRSVEHQEFRR